MIIHMHITYISYRRARARASTSAASPSSARCRRASAMPSRRAFFWGRPKRASLIRGEAE